jgi:hypothetical protein
MPGLPNLRAFGAGREKGVLLIPGELGYVAFAIDAQQLSISVDDRERII